MKLRWDLFCSVVDNYGDIGICWRISRELVSAYGQQVRLWVDDLDSFHRIWPAVSPDRPLQTCEGVEIRHWMSNSAEVEPGDVVVEAFACRVPTAFLQSMATRTLKPVWLNLEYFSAETWVAECHGLRSPHPRLPLTQYFFIPGLGTGTGGVPGDHGELKALRQFQHDDRATRTFRQSLQIPQDAGLCISLFAYENPAVCGLMEALAAHAQAVTLLVPEGRVLAQVAACPGLDAGFADNPKLGQSARMGNLEIRVLPFMPQDAYDRLLWSSDLNFVRGEDSFVRAQHAARPMVWQPYVQADGAQWQKLEAFSQQYMRDLLEPARLALEEVWRVWNAGEHKPTAWREWLAHLPEYRLHARQWADWLGAQPGLVDELVKFSTDKL